MSGKKRKHNSSAALVVTIVILAAVLLGMLIWTGIRLSQPEPTGPSSDTVSTEPSIPIVPFDPTYPSTAPTEPSSEPTQPKPTQPKPTEPKPTEPKPTEPKPTEPKPTEPKPTEPKPTEPKPTQPKPTDPTEPLPEGTMRLVTDVTVYREPDIHSKDDGVLLKGNMVQVVKYEKDWITIQLGQQIRYIPSGTVREPGKYLVVIDAGHQGKANYDKEPIGPGAEETKSKVTSGTQGRYTGFAEYKLNLLVAKKLQTILEERGYEVVMIRTTHDVDISNAERAAVANALYADCFIRIHANGSDDKSVNGIETICQTKDNPFNADIYEECLALSTAVLDETAATTGAKRRYVWQTDTMSGINWCQIPVTIIEMGYMTNKTEDELMYTDAYQNKLALGIANGIDRFFEEQG